MGVYAVEVALILLVAGILVFHGWSDRRKDRDHARDVGRLVDALVARNASEYAGLRLVDETPEPRAPRVPREEEFQVGS